MPDAQPPRDLAVTFTALNADGTAGESQGTPMFPADMPESERERILTEIGEEWTRLTAEAAEQENTDRG